MADSSDSVVSNNCKDLSAVQSSDKADEFKTDKGRCFLSKKYLLLAHRSFLLK